MPPPNPAGIELGFVLTATTLLPVICVLRIVTVGCETQHWSMLMPPAKPIWSSKSIEPMYSTVLSLTTLSSMSSAPTLPMPPELALFAIALSATAWLPLTTLL